MKKNIILIGIVLLSFIIIGCAIYQNNYINTKLKIIDEKLEILSSSNNQQDIQINQLTEKQRKIEQQETLENSVFEIDESIFENTPTDGLTPISEDKAKKIWEDYLINTLSENINDYDVSEIKTAMVKPSNYFTAGALSIRTANFERNAYFLRYTKKDKLEEVIGYVDMYTGNVIGGYYSGD